MGQLLIVDNEPESIVIRGQWLKEDGYKVFTVTTLSGAWDYINDYREDNNGELPQILLDIMMPTIDDLDWLSEYEQDNTKITAPTAGLEFAEKLKKTYPKIVVCWHSVRHKTELAVAKKTEKLGFGIIQKDLQNRTEFLKEINKVFNK